MDHLSTNLLFEMMGYYPITLFTIEVLNKKHREMLHSRIDALQTMIEDVYSRNLRDRDFPTCKKFVKDRYNPAVFFVGEKTGTYDFLEGEAKTLQLRYGWLFDRIGFDGEEKEIGDFKGGAHGTFEGGPFTAIRGETCMYTCTHRLCITFLQFRNAEGTWSKEFGGKGKHDSRMIEEFEWSNNGFPISKIEVWTRTYPCGIQVTF